MNIKSKTQSFSDPSNENMSLPNPDISQEFNQYDSIEIENIRTSFIEPKKKKLTCLMTSAQMIRMKKSWKKKVQKKV